MYTLPPVEKARKEKVGRTYKYILTEEQKQWLHDNAKADRQALADALGVSLRTVKSLLKSMSLIHNSRVRREREEMRQKEREVKQTVKKIIKGESDPIHPTMFIAGQDTGKTLNGVQLTNEHHLAISELQMAGESPKANTDLYARIEAEKVLQRRKEREEQRRKDDAVRKFNAKVDKYLKELRQQYQDIGKYYPVVSGLLRNVATCRVRDDEAQEQLTIQGMEIEVVSASGIRSYQTSPAYTRAQETGKALREAYQKLGTEIDKIDRRSGEDEEGVSEFDKLMRAMKAEDEE